MQMLDKDEFRRMIGGCSGWRKSGLLKESSVVRKWQAKGLSEQEIYRKIRDGEVKVD